MDEIILKDFRCFHGEQTARLAPLTLLVGDNSTGKTSFLAAIRALWDTVHKQQVPDFKEPPYDLGNFPELVYHWGGKGGPASSFSVGFADTVPNVEPGTKPDPYRRMEFRMRIEESRTVPVLHSRSLSDDRGTEVTEFLSGSPNNRSFRLTTKRGSWDMKMLGVMPEMPREAFDLPFLAAMMDLYRVLGWELRESQIHKVEYQPVGSAPQITKWDKIEVQEILWLGRSVAGGSTSRARRESVQPPFAGAPARSKPRRIYEPSSLEQNAEGDRIPMYLDDIRVRYPSRWSRLKKQLEEFGSEAGLFDEIGIKPLGEKGGAGFLVQVRKFSGPRTRALKGPQRNLIDMGYGVSQILPVATELLRRNSSTMFLLQQPEVHLHPSAQAALGSLFCRAVSERKHQLVVETHSDYLLDRIRMLIRHRKTKLKPEDISILFFERYRLGVSIHSLRLDEQGKVQDAPEGYRRFFMEEFDRLFGLEDVRDS